MGGNKGCFYSDCPLFLLLLYLSFSVSPTSLAWDPWRERGRVRESTRGKATQIFSNLCCPPRYVTPRSGPIHTFIWNIRTLEWCALEWMVVYHQPRRRLREGQITKNRSLTSFPLQLNYNLSWTEISWLTIKHCDNVCRHQGLVTCFLASSLWLVGRNTAAIQPRQVVY